jgi:hypothetical protein
MPVVVPHCPLKGPQLGGERLSLLWDLGEGGRSRVARKKVIMQGFTVAWHRVFVYHTHGVWFQTTPWKRGAQKVWEVGVQRVLVNGP